MEERLRYLFKQYVDNTCSRQELEEFFDYVRKAKHDAMLKDLIRKVYEETREKNPGMTYVNESGSLVLNDAEWIPTETKKSTYKTRKLLLSLGVAACLLLTIAFFWMNDKPGAADIQTKSKPFLARNVTGRSEYKYLLLPDSTQVWLNAASSLEFPNNFLPGSREVTLSGEAYFDVKHADKIPFIIHTGKVSTTVLGTAFNIKAYPGGKNVVISVSRGKVNVHLREKLIATLTKGQEVKVGETNVLEKAIPVAKVAAWQEGNMVYEDENFEDIINDLQRVYDVNIRVENEAVRNLKISTSFRRQIGIEQALQVLCKLIDAELKQSDGIYIIR